MKHFRSTWSLWLLLLAVSVRICFSTFVGLGDDEAYYWEWSRHFQLSYFDHPPMVAWLIRAGTEIFGDTPLGVRFFGQVCGLFSGYLIFELARRLWNLQVANRALLFYLLCPLFSVGTLLMVPDAPLGMAWLLACLLLHKIFLVGQERWQTWIALGIVLGLGLLSKYPIVLLGLSTVVLAMTESRWRRYFFSAQLWVSIALFAFCIFPLIEWNAQHEWQSFQFQFLNRFQGTSPFRLSRTLEFLASQLATMGPPFFSAILATAVIALRRWQDLRWRWLSVLSIPTFCIFAFQSAFSDFKAHWPAPAYPLLLIGLAAWTTEWRPWERRTLLALQMLLVVPVIAIIHWGAARPVIPDVVMALAPQIHWEPKYDPTNDLYGWREVGSDAMKLADQLGQSRPQKPFLSSERYQVVSQLEFATHAGVFRVLDDVDNYSYTQAEALSLLVGRDTIFVSDSRFPRDPREENRFRDCSPIKRTTVFRGQRIAREFQLWFCTDYRGINQLLHYNPSRGRFLSAHRWPAQQLFLQTAF